MGVGKRRKEWVKPRWGNNGKRGRDGGKKGRGSTRYEVIHAFIFVYYCKT